MCISRLSGRKVIPVSEGPLPSVHPWRSCLALATRECLRVSKLWTQTMLAPVVSSILFILVFGLSLGSRIADFSGIPYEQFIVPGLIAMAMAQAAYANNSASLYQARSDRYINDVISAPMHPWQMHFGYAIGGAFRALVIGAALTILAVFLTGVPIEHPLPLLVGSLLLVTLFGGLGMVVGVYAESWDHTSFVNNIVILPLTFVGGVFYTTEILPQPWQELSHLNPVFYMVNAIRYGFLGISDVSPWLSFGVTAVFAAVLIAWSQWLFTSGRRLKP